jgi:uncharacterized repeat protein (TIGR01451 family)
MAGAAALLVALAGPLHAAVFNIPSGDVAALIAAITTANANSEADTINLAAGVYTLVTVNNTDDGPSGLPSIKGAITIRGAGANATTIERAPGGPAFRIFRVAATGTLTLDGLTVRGGNASDGGGILSAGALTVANSVVRDNEAINGGGIKNLGPLVLTNSTIAGNDAASGAGIHNAGTLNVTGSSISSNTSQCVGGGLVTTVGATTLVRSTVAGNTALCRGGGVVMNGNTVTVVNSTISGNGATDSAGGILIDTGTLTVTNSTISGNGAGAGGGIWNGTGHVELHNTIVAGSPSGGNCAATTPLVSKGHNIDSGTTCNLTGTGDLTNSDPRLGPLANNSGGTLTHALLPGSPAIGAGDAAGCPATDQRGLARPQGTACEIGAFETSVSADLSVSKTAAPNPVAVGGHLVYTVTVTNVGASAASGVVLTDDLPDGVNFVSATPTQGTCSGAVSCNLGSLAFGASATVTIEVTPTAAGSTTNTADVTWTGTDPTPGPTTATVTTSVVADQFTLTVTRPGSGVGTVTGPGIDCGTDCTELFADGAGVTLTATAAAGSVFSGWSGCDFVSDAVCTVSMTTDRAVTATFSALVYTLTVARTGSGSGTVDSSSPGIACGGDCSETYPYGAVVTLRATPDPTSRFTGWSGGGCSGTGGCTLALTGNLSIAATFDRRVLTNVLKDGGFEAGTPNPFWFEFSTQYGTPLCTVAVCGAGDGTGPHGGSVWAWFGGVNGVEQGSMSQNVVLPVGDAILSFWLEMPHGSGTGADHLQVSLDGSVVFAVTDAASATYSSYRRVTVNVCRFATGATRRLAFDAISVGGGVTNFFVDDVSLDTGPLATTFCDVPVDHWAFSFVDALVGAGVTAGCTTMPVQYCPDAPVTREQMAVFLLRAREGGSYQPPPCTTAPFGDVPCSSAFAPWIRELVARGVTAGCGGGSYCPGDPVTREQMAVFLLKALEGTGFAPPSCVVANFTDVTCSNVFARWVQELIRRGITAGCAAGLYCPHDPVTRAQMAVFLVKTFNLSF